MHRSSSSIGGLAAALAKAQAELVNPEKSLVGSIYSDAPDGTERIFRYAPLSAGLDINASISPPCGFIATAMDLAMMASAQRHGELVADLTA